jgi:hypothetical protein
MCENVEKVEDAADLRRHPLLYGLQGDRCQQKSAHHFRMGHIFFSIIGRIRQSVLTPNADAGQHLA